MAAIEQHLEHLAMEHDWRSVCHVAVGVAEKLRPRVVVAEGLMAGVSEHHMNHPGTLSSENSTAWAFERTCQRRFLGTRLNPAKASVKYMPILLVR